VPYASTLALALSGTCLLCSCALAADNESGVCSPCRRSRAGYDPGTDPGFGVVLAALFLTHPGEVVHPLRALAIEPCYKWSVVTWVRRLRRRGAPGAPGPMRIEGLPHSGGYIFWPANPSHPSGRCRGRRRT
jgi:hypothetical protein